MCYLHNVSASSFSGRRQVFFSSASPPIGPEKDSLVATYFYVPCVTVEQRGCVENRTRVLRVIIQRTNHYTIQPDDVWHLTRSSHSSPLVGSGDICFRNSGSHIGLISALGLLMDVGSSVMYAASLIFLIFQCGSLSIICVSSHAGR